jgi:hypothetical protein
VRFRLLFVNENLTFVHLVSDIVAHFPSLQDQAYIMIFVSRGPDENGTAHVDVALHIILPLYHPEISCNVALLHSPSAEFRVQIGSLNALAKSHITS